MADRPRKPWRVILTGPDVTAESDHTSQTAAYALIRAALGDGSPATEARVMQWADGRWWHYETIAPKQQP